MKLQSHTLGPWTVDYTDDGLCIYAGELLIAEVHGSTELFEVQGLDEQTMEANASLIAAAPDLLGALERMMEHGDRRNLYYEHGEDAEIVDQARAAIAKARVVWTPEQGKASSSRPSPARA